MKPFPARRAVDVAISLLLAATLVGCSSFDDDAPVAAAPITSAPRVDIGSDPDPDPDPDPDSDSDLGLDRSGGSSEIAVIVDTPYREKALESFPLLIDSIDSREEIELVVHVGDIKSGDTLCSDEWFQRVYQLFASFEDPLIYTPGDNEWADCHRANNGGYDPLERLATLREIFFDFPGFALGGGLKRVRHQQGYPENQLWFESGVTFATVHQVGSNNAFSYADRSSTGDRERLLAAFEERSAANAAFLGEIFALAEREDAAGVALFLHADMWRPAGRLEGDRMDGHQRFVEALAPLVERFGRPVLMLSGDSHDYRVDAPVEWFELYGVASPENLTQIIVDRTIENEDIEWLRLSVDPLDPMVFRWEQVVVPLD